ncbi:epithelial sodium channel subunit gamma-like [Glandiceps talaboti]
MLSRCDGLNNCYDASDELGCSDNVCGNDFFRCNNGRCIDMEERCDGQYHCSGDEDMCTDNVCPLNYFICKNGQCISLNERCDFRLDCNDGSDEVNCTTVQCPNEYFRCQSGQCVLAELHCNGQVDCVDGRDEFNCTGLEPPPVICNDDEFKCISIEKCIISSFVCNDIDDCGDNSDESECTFTVVCKADEFKCKGGESEDDYCIPLLWLCDRINQCGDGTDELDCKYVIEDVFSNPEWKTPYLNITNNDKIFEEFVRLVYVNRNFDFVPSEDPPSWNQFLLASSTPDFTDLQDVLKLSPKNLAIFGHQAEDFILQCTYDQKKCSYSEFLVFQHDKYGNCFTFNHQLENGNSTLRKATTAGADFGLKLTLFLEQNEYIGLFGQQSGVRVVIHHPTVKPFPEDEGVYVNPGAVTSISIKLNKRTRMRLPHGNCTDQKISEDNIYEYSALACQKICLQKFLYSKCGCVDTLSDDRPRCSVLNKTQDACKQLMHFFYQSSLLTCDCQQPCSQSSYSKTISQALWPSLSNLPHLLNGIHASNRKTWSIRDKESAREDLVRLEVYYEDLNFNLVSEEEAYPVFQLLSDTGGSLGLWIGLSFITVIEFVEFLVTLCQAARKRSHERMRRYSTRRRKSPRT